MLRDELAQHPFNDEGGVDAHFHHKQIKNIYVNRLSILGTNMDNQNNYQNY